MTITQIIAPVSPHPKALAEAARAAPTLWNTTAFEFSSSTAQTEQIACTCFISSGLRLLIQSHEMHAPRPFSFAPMLCVSAEWPPEGPEWRYELKLDGFRAIGCKSGRTARLWSRNQKSFARRFPGVLKAIWELPSDTVIDGEIVALDDQGKPSFNLLQGFGPAAATVMYAFDSICLCCEARMRAAGLSKNAVISFKKLCEACQRPSGIRRPSGCRGQTLSGR